MYYYYILVIISVWASFQEVSCEETCGKPAVNPHSKIVGGKEAKRYSWPWQVSLRDDNNGHFCGGSIINEQWILSAAHCPADWLCSISAGVHNLKEEGEYYQSIEVEKVIPHEDPDRHDIMLIKLKEPLTFSRAVRPVCLPQGEEMFELGARCFATGWGTLKSQGASPDVLMEVSVPILSNEVCNQADWYNGLIKDIEICAGYAEGGKDTCQGDSGGPLVTFKSGRWYLVGATSWGKGCADAKKPGLYARVSYYLDWINNVISGNNDDAGVGFCGGSNGGGGESGIDSWSRKNNKAPKNKKFQEAERTLLYKKLLHALKDVKN